MLRSCCLNAKLPDQVLAKHAYPGMIEDDSAALQIRRMVTDHHVLFDRQLRYNAFILPIRRNERQAAANSCDRVMNPNPLAVEVELSGTSISEEAVEGRKKLRLAGAQWAEHAKNVALVDVDVDRSDADRAQIGLQYSPTP